MSNIIEVSNLIHIYKENIEIVALNGISFSIKANEKVAIVGKSGSGKTTLIYCLAGLIRPSAGKIYIQNQDITAFTDEELANHRLQTVGIVFQDGNLSDALTVRENIELPLILKDETKENRRKRVIELAKALEIEKYLDTYPHLISGGERQRVAVAVALANNPPILLADEPTGNLDYETSQLVYQLFREAAEEFHTTLVIVSHDTEINKHVDRIINLPQLQMHHQQSIEG